MHTRSTFDRSVGVEKQHPSYITLFQQGLSYRIGLEGGMIFSREKLNAEYNICPTLENRRTQGGKDIPAKSRLPSPWGSTIAIRGIDSSPSTPPVNARASTFHVIYANG